jgi:hypothetical protein
LFAIFLIGGRYLDLLRLVHALFQTTPLVLDLVVGEVLLCLLPPQVLPLNQFVFHYNSLYRFLFQKKSITIQNLIL